MKMTNHYQNGVVRAQQEIANKMCGRVENAIRWDQNIMYGSYATVQFEEKNGLPWSTDVKDEKQLQEFLAQLRASSRVNPSSIIVHK
jgi:hypothetical protein